MKPENILYDSETDTIKLIDFGFSKILQDENGLMGTRLGTPYYISPEVLKGKYDKGCDMWSVGVITYFFMTGEVPFIADTAAKLYKLINTCDFRFNQDIWQKCSKDAKKFISALIEPNISRRLTVE